MLLSILDGEGLYTLVGIKPMSSGFVDARIGTTGTNLEARTENIAKTERLRQAMAALRIGDLLSTGLVPFANAVGADRYLDGYVFHHGAITRTIERQQGFFAYYGVTPSTPPSEVVMAFEPDEGPHRFRAFGWLYGYPDHAVDFFVQADLDRRTRGEFVQRDFFQIPTFTGDTGQFVYAVPKGYAPQSVDLDLRAKAVKVLEFYRELREQFIGEGKKGPVELVREWMDDGTGRCSPETALRKALDD